METVRELRSRVMVEQERYDILATSNLISDSKDKPRALIFSDFR
jgi:hypothetical protein